MREIITQAEVLNAADDTPTSELGELARAVHLALPGLRDAAGVAMVIRNMLRNRGVELVRVPNSTARRRK